MLSTLLLTLGGDIPGLVTVTPASAAAANSAYAMNRPGRSRRGRELRLRDQCQWRGRRPFIPGQGVLFKCGRHTGRLTQSDPFSWTVGTMIGLGTFSATAMIEVTAVNRGGDVVADSGGHTLLVHNGTMTELGTGEATASTTSARSSPAAPTPKATSTRSRSHPASDRPRTYHPLA